MHMRNFVNILCHTQSGGDEGKQWLRLVIEVNDHGMPIHHPNMSVTEYILKEHNKIALPPPRCPDWEFGCCGADVDGEFDGEFYDEPEERDKYGKYEDSVCEDCGRSDFGFAECPCYRVVDDDNNDDNWI